MSTRTWITIIAWLAVASAAAGDGPVELADLDADVEWVVDEVAIEGSEFFSARSLKSRLLTRPRPWYTPWRARPAFDPASFERDLERIRRVYETEGFFEVEVRHALEASGERLAIEIQIAEGARAHVSSIDVEREAGSGADPPLPELPIRAGDPFTEEAYRDAEAVLRTALLNQGHAHGVVERHAKVALDRRGVEVRYRMAAGPETTFGDTEIEGLAHLDPVLLRRELAYEPGEPFSLTAIEQSRSDLLALNLLSAVQLTPNPSGPAAPRVPMRLRVTEKPPREIRVGIGYSTDELFRAQLQWSHYNWLGGGRQLTLAAQYSSVTSAGDVAFVQPYLLGDRRNRGLVNLRVFQDDEQSYTLNGARLVPAFERRLTPTLVATLGLRAGAADVLDVDETVSARIGGVRNRGLFWGPIAQLRWDRRDDVFRPTRGQLLTLAAEHAGLGGDYAFYKVGGEVAQYLALGFETVLAGRLKLGFADALGADRNLPIFERLYAGGERSVRGYARRRLGPLSASDDAVGGRSLFEGSIELRRPIWRGLGGVLFLDFGQVSLDRFELPVDDLEFSAGPGITYDTPLGPLSLFVGIPFDPPAEDAGWQIHFSIGHFF